jgi:hypothetical protein
MGVAIKNKTVETLESGTVIGRTAGRVAYARTTDGTMVNYEDSQITSMVTKDATYAKYEEGKIEHIERDDGTYVQYVDGKIDYFRDAQGNEVHYKDGRISSVIDADGNVVSYDDKGNVTTITDQSMRRAKFGKDGNIDISEPVFDDKDNLKKIMKGNAMSAQRAQEVAKARMLGIATNADWLKRSMDKRVQNLNLMMNMADRGR